MDKDLITELILPTIRDQQSLLVKQAEAIAELDKQISLINMKIGVASTVVGTAVGLVVNYILGNV